MKLFRWSLCVLSLYAACVEDAPPGPSSDDLAQAKKDLLATPPTPKFPVNADLDGKVVYLGLDCDQATLDPNRKFTLTHYWKVVQPPGEGWRIFTHLHGANKSNFMNVDHTPIQGRYPVSSWKAGDIIRDSHDITLGPGFSSPTLEVYVGLWRGNERMAIKSGPHDDESRVKAAVIPVTGTAQATPPPEAARKRYVVRRIKDGAVKIDGKLSEDVWAQAAVAGPFVDTMTGGAVEQKTTVKALYDSKNLYVAFENEDSDVWTTLVKRDDKLWTEEADEIMIDADGDKKTYVELQVNPAGTIFDTYLPTYRQREDDFDAGMKVAVKVDGTLNKRDDKDKGWTVELSVPLIKIVAPKGDKSGPIKLSIPPKPGDMWRANFYRMDVPKDKRQVGSGWNPPLVGDFHALDKFGELVFADDKGVVPVVKPPPPPLNVPPMTPGMIAPGMRGPKPPQGVMKGVLPALPPAKPAK